MSSTRTESVSLMKLVHPDFNVGKQARAVLKALKHARIENDPLVYTRTAPWYNGRERGVLFTVESYAKRKSRHVAVFEHRNSDDLHALVWEEDLSLNPPTIDSSAEKAYKGQDKYYHDHMVQHGEAEKMAKWVKDQMLNFIKEKEECTPPA